MEYIGGIYWESYCYLFSFYLFIVVFSLCLFTKCCCLCFCFQMFSVQLCHIVSSYYKYFEVCVSHPTCIVLLLYALQNENHSQIIFDEISCTTLEYTVLAPFFEQL